MRQFTTFNNPGRILSVIMVCLCISTSLFAQQPVTTISDYVIFGGTNGVLAGQKAPAAPGYGVQIGSSTSIQGGFIGSYKLVQSTGNAAIGTNTLPSNIYSGGSVVLANNNVVQGNITAANAYIPQLPAGTAIFSAGTGETLSGNIDVNGNIVVGGGTVSGIVTNPTGTTYKLGGVTIANPKGTPTLPVLPQMPAITDYGTLPSGSANITSTKTVGPGGYGNISIGGNTTLTLSGPGIYVFKSITTAGPNSQIVFDFNNTTAGNFLIYVYGDVVLNKTQCSMIRGGSASRIYTEVHGNGSTDTNDKTASFNMSNGSNGNGNTSGWFGSVWAPFAAIKVGSPNGPAMSVTGALWSGTQVNILDGISVTFASINLCVPPNANAGPDKPFNFNGITTLTGTSTTTTGISYSWKAPVGGAITTPANQATVSVSAPGIYTLTVTAAAGCATTDEVVVTNKVNNLIGSELTSVYYNNPTGLPSPFFIITPGYITIDVVVKVSNYNYILGLLQQTSPENYGLKNIITNGENGTNKSELIITGDFPIANLLKLNALSAYINFCRPYYQAFSNSGLVNSAGDTTMRSNLVRSGYKINGDGIKVGVISNSYATITNGTTTTLPLQPITDPTNPIAQTFTTNTAAQDVTNGDLPGVGNPNGYTKPVNVLVDYPVKSSDEGRAMLQIVHDVAPGAELYFRTGFFTAGDFATGIKELTAAGCKVIVDDVTYITEPFLKDGVVAKAVNDVKAQGVSYFSAAGNFANKSYEKDFAPVDAAPAGFAGRKAHNFSGNGVDIFQHISMAPGNYTIVLQWVDDIFSNGQVQGTHYDLDMFWTSNTDGTALKGFNRDNTNGDPLEILPFTINTTTDANFLIVNNTTDGNPARIKYIIYRGDVQILEYNAGTSTVVGQANATGAIAVGAARYDKAPPYLTLPLIESFSSFGGTKTEGVIRNKPDLVAPDGGNTTVKLGQDYPNTALDGYSNFFGTSAAAPHAAAVAALIMEGKKKFLNQDVSLSTPDEIRSLLQLTAVDMETANNQAGTKFDFVSGYGLVDADSAMRTFAAPTATLIKVVVPTTVIPCSGTPFTVTITGENFSRNTVVMLINGPGDTTRVIPTFISSSEVSVTINSCIGNPEIKAYTPPKDGTNGKDGGFSNSLYFFSGSITITASDITKKYGELLPALSSVIKVDGVLLQNTNPLLTLQDIGLANITLTTVATSNSDVGTYIITPSRIFDQSNPVDAALQKKYSYKFNTGIVTIAKMPLKVTPNDKTVNYGQSIGNVTYKYEFNTANIYNPDSLLNVIKKFHELFLPYNALAVIKDFKKPQSGGYILSNTDLANMNTLASLNALKNSRKFTLLNNTLLPVTDPATLLNTLNIQYLVDVASQSIYNYKIDPSKAKFFPVFPNVNSKALLSAVSIDSDDKGTVELNGGKTVKIFNGSLAQMVTGIAGPIVPIVNGFLVQVIDGETVPVSADLVQYVNDGSWVKISSTGTLVKVQDGLIKLANGTLVKLVGGVTYVQFANGSLVKLVQGSLVKLVQGTNTVVYANGDPISDSTLIMLANGLVQAQNGSLETIVSGSLVKLVQGSLVKLVQGSLVKLVQGSLVKLVQGTELGTDSPNNNTAIIMDTTDADDGGTGYSSLGSMFGINMITGLDAGTQYLIPGVLVNTNFDITYGLGTVDIQKAIITIKANDATRQYGENNPEFKVTYSGFAPGDSLLNVGIIGVSGSPALSTTATQTSSVGSYPITVANGTLASSNYAFSFVNGALTVTTNQCLITHDPMNFVSTSNALTSLWMPITIKISGQLTANGDYIMFKAGTITFNNITSNPTVTNLPVPNGKIVAVTGRTSPLTHFDLLTNTWITEVPPGYASTSDIFITGAIINSSNGFVKKNNQANSVVKGIFYSNKNFSDQWAYSMAAYQPQFAYTDVDGAGEVTSINGTYRAGTPTTELTHIVSGGSGNGGNNYTGSSSNQNAFTACIPTNPSAVNRVITSSSPLQEAARQAVQDLSSAGKINVFPNPASAHITLSYIPTHTGNTKIVLFTIDGNKVSETDNGVWKAGKKYVTSMDVSKLVGGVYLIQLVSADKITMKKIIITR